MPSIASPLIHSNNAQDFNSTAAAVNFIIATTLSTTSNTTTTRRGVRNRVSSSAPSISRFSVTATLAHQPNGSGKGATNGWRAISVINTLPSIGRDGFICPNTHSDNKARPKSISLPWRNK